MGVDEQDRPEEPPADFCSLKRLHRYCLSEEWRTPSAVLLRISRLLILQPLHTPPLTPWGLWRTP